MTGCQFHNSKQRLTGSPWTPRGRGDVHEHDRLQQGPAAVLLLDCGQTACVYRQCWLGLAISGTGNLSTLSKLQVLSASKRGAEPPVPCLRELKPSTLLTSQCVGLSDSLVLSVDKMNLSLSESVLLKMKGQNRARNNCPCFLALWVTCCSRRPECMLICDLCFQNLNLQGDGCRLCSSLPFVTAQGCKESVHMRKHWEPVLYFTLVPFLKPVSTMSLSIATSGVVMCSYAAEGGISLDVSLIWAHALVDLRC